MTPLFASVLCWMFDHPGYIRRESRWHCVRCDRVPAVG